MTVGTLEEAQAIFQAKGDPLERTALPPGWREIGAGGSRHCYLSPSGVVYKLCHYNGDEWPSYNDFEQANFERIRQSGKLPEGWRVPKSHLHFWRDNISRYTTRMEKEAIPARVAVLAVEYIDGEGMGGLCHNTLDETLDMEKAFSAVGLFDFYGANAIKRQDGTRYIIDAAEKQLIGV